MQPTGTVTFLFTDIEGSTKLWKQQPDAMRPALARHDQILRQSIEDNQGYVFKTVGDAFCAAFASAPEAVSAVLTAQVALAAASWETDRPLRVRMGLHTGVCEERGGDYFGPPLNRAARLVAAGAGGQVLLSSASQELCRDALPASASLLDLGEHRLKDLGRPERVFQLLHPALAADLPPLKSLDNPALPNNLPQQPTSFVGREKEAAEVKTLLAETRLLTLTAAGGSGKTRLSLQVAADLLDGDGDGVWLVELAPLADPALVAQAAAEVLGVKEQAGQTIQKTLIAALKEKRLLLVLDNCEHLLAACASLASDLLRSCPGVHILASSREPLGVPGEQVYRVPPLSLPDPKTAQTAESLSQFEAVRLFLDWAKAVQPLFVVSDANAPAVAQVRWRSDGIPLALELVAARVRAMPVEQAMARLDDRFRLLTGGSKTLLPRQQTLRALIDWSYDLLTDGEKALLRRLSVFAGGWTLEAAEGVCAGQDIEDREVIEDWEVLDLLMSLVDKSLAVYEERGAEEARYHLLETVRQYAADRLGEAGEAEGTGARAASWFVTLAEEAEEQLRGPEQALWLGRLEADHDNLRASLSWYERPPAGTEKGTEEGAADGLRLAGVLWRFWSVRGHLSEGRGWLGRALSRPEDGLPKDGLPEDGPAGTGAAAARAKALKGAGHLARNQGDYRAAQALHEENLRIVRQLGDQQGIAGALGNLGTVAQMQDDYAAARALLAESLGLCRQLGDQEGIAEGLEVMAGIVLGLGQPERAARLGAVGAALRLSFGSARSSFDQEKFETLRAEVAAALGEAAFAAAEAAGRALTPDAAVDYAREGSAE